MIDKLKNIEFLLPSLINDPSIWKTLDIDYYPPRVERLWTELNDGTRLFIHVIHPTESPCLFHKHRWPAAFKIIQGKYEMGLSYSESEIDSDSAYETLPMISKFILDTGSYYEMTNTHSLHYVKPLDDISISLMITGPLYKESEYRKEVLNKKLNPLTDNRRNEILNTVFKNLLYK